MERHTYIRIHQIDSLIRQGLYPNCQRLAEEFETSQRTVLRDIEAMKDSLGAPIAYSKEKNGYYYSQGNFRLPEMKLTEGELLAVCLGADLLNKYKGAPFEKAIKNAFQKIQLRLPNEVTIDLKEQNPVYSFDVQETLELDDNSAKVIAQLARAIHGRKQAEIEYYSIGRDAHSCRIIDPYHLRHALGTWYLIAFCHKSKDIRTFAVRQIKKIKVLAKTFTIPADFSPTKFFAGSWHLEEGGPLTKVVVRIDKKIARWFKNRRLHPSQKARENKDGSLDLSFEVTGTSEIKRWILSQGSMIKVLEPYPLKRDILNELLEIKELNKR